MSQQLHSGPGQTQTPVAGLEVALTECCLVHGAMALEQALHERSSNGGNHSEKTEQKEL